mgnify:CR=1 FL=1
MFWKRISRSDFLLYIIKLFFFTLVNAISIKILNHSNRTHHLLSFLKLLRWDVCVAGPGVSHKVAWALTIQFVLLVGTVAFGLLLNISWIRSAEIEYTHLTLFLFLEEGLNIDVKLMIDRFRRETNKFINTCSLFIRECSI